LETRDLKVSILELAFPTNFCAIRFFFSGCEVNLLGQLISHKLSQQQMALLQVAMAANRKKN
jgi:hypothetical protein